MKTMDSKQEILNYAIYMIGGSYFNKTRFLAPYLEKRLRMKYVETKQDVQCELENKCIEFIEGTLLTKLPKEVWDQDVTVRMTPNGVYFLGPQYAVCIKASKEGRNITFSYEAGKKAECETA